jgi:hypothetical protein
MKQLTIEEFNHIPSGEIFAKGVTLDIHEGCDMTGSGKSLRWLAKKGQADDWCVYVNLSIYPFPYIARHGDKVHSKQNVTNLVPCTNEVFRHYRY